MKRILLFGNNAGINGMLYNNLQVVLYNKKRGERQEGIRMTLGIVVVLRWVIKMQG
ncbi:hypothetical protein [Paenibacillus faecalis]|uniref:hypothetical protein n=1 Tax=Paenibacillus faecalis TaxID=2079532 RepID=UPI00131A5233|nr:hypothetical protein [Paenibacillus faecalis]